MRRNSEVVELSQTQRRTGQRTALVMPVSTTVQSKKVAVNKPQLTGKVKSKTDESADEKNSYAKASSQSGVKSVAKSQPSRKTEKKAISKVSSLKREQPDIFKTFSTPKPKMNREDTGSSAGTSSVIATAHSVRHILAASSFMKLKVSSKRALAFMMTVRVSR